VAPDRTETLTKTGQWPTHEVEPVDIEGVATEPRAVRTGHSVDRRGRPSRATAENEPPQ